ncbi:Cytoplasmic tRNA 2-thiolation protein 2 [Platanthera zijinensis]|uniref:Cytoplasmic tRNA 2-thiolation protein 2 n=1 Tax=Platanthera zijinensis TaxID=2320716 RepID=A0AAP0BKA3_9ASPA
MRLRTERRALAIRQATSNKRGGRGEQERRSRRAGEQVAASRKAGRGERRSASKKSRSRRAAISELEEQVAVKERERQAEEAASRELERSEEESARSDDEDEDEEEGDGEDDHEVGEKEGKKKWNKRPLGVLMLRVALQFILDIQFKSLRNWDASKSQGLPVFGIGVAFVDQSSVSLNSPNLMINAIEEISSIVSELAPLHVASIESIFGKGFDDGVKCLNELLDSITDATGKEDFIKYLRMLSLQKIALDNKYTKLLLGSCTSKMAREIISATVKVCL